MNAKKQGLGRGLNALLENAEMDITGRNAIPLYNIAEIPINEIEANPFQPRENFSDNDLEELAESIRIHGIIQPVTVRKAGYGKYQLISGERRTRAAIRAGLEKIPAYVRLADDQGMLEMSLIENIHRENLNAIEIAISYKRLMDECQLKHEEIAARIGKERSTITNYLRLLKLPDSIQAGLRDNKINMGHARSIISIDDSDTQMRIYKTIIEEDLSVREVEELVKLSKNEISTDKTQTSTSKVKIEKSDSIVAWEKYFVEKLNPKVKIRLKRKGKGELIIPFNSEKDLELFADIFKKE